MPKTLLKRKYRYIEVLVKDDRREVFVGFNVPFSKELNDYLDDLRDRHLSPRCFVRIRTKNDGCSHGF